MKKIWFRFKSLNVNTSASYNLILNMEQICTGGRDKKELLIKYCECSSWSCVFLITFKIWTFIQTLSPVQTPLRGKPFLCTDICFELQIKQRSFLEKKLIWIFFWTSGCYWNQIIFSICLDWIPGSQCHSLTTLCFTHHFTALHQLGVVFEKIKSSNPFFSPPLTQGFTYVAPSVLENVKERFSFEPKLRSPRKFPGSSRTLLR